MAGSVFASQAGDLFASYEATLAFRDRVLGGIPKTPKLIEGWLRSRAGIERADEVRAMMLSTLRDLGAEVSPEMSLEALEEASSKLAAQSAVGFKRDEAGIYLEDRQLKAALKEATNILFAGERWGPTRKGPKGYVAERVFIGPARIHFFRAGRGVIEPDGVELFTGHVTGPSGPRSTLTYYEYVEQPQITVTVQVLRDSETDNRWPQLWLLMQDLGLGALRSQSYGRYDVVDWRPV